MSLNYQKKTVKTTVCRSHCTIRVETEEELPEPEPRRAVAEDREEELQVFHPDKSDGREVEQFEDDRGVPERMRHCSCVKVRNSGSKSTPRAISKDSLPRTAHAVETERGGGKLPAWSNKERENSQQNPPNNNI